MTPATRSGFVAIVGRPNVGKSTLTNRLVGGKVAIVSAAPQTTRRRILGICNRPGGQCVIFDTPGIHKPHHEMNRRMVADATEAMAGADLIMFMCEVEEGWRTTSGFGPGDRFILSRLPREGVPVVLGINKIDRVKKSRLLPIIDSLKDAFPFREILLFSALTGDNTGDLAEKLISWLPEGEPLYPEDELTDQTVRAMACELIREKLLNHTRQELPHETCVLLDLYADEPALTRIEATVLVDRESQRKMVIGREGGMMKAVGTEAREEIERLIGRKVFLRIWVKVREGWRDDRRVLSQLGLDIRGREP